MTLMKYEYSILSFSSFFYVFIKSFSKFQNFKLPNSEFQNSEFQNYNDKFLSCYTEFYFVITKLIILRFTSYIELY